MSKILLSRGPGVQAASPLHRLDARAKLGALLIFLIAVSSTPPSRPRVLAALLLLPLAAAFAARLPVRRLLARAAIALPFTAMIALAAGWNLGLFAALVLLAKSMLSLLSTGVIVAITPFPAMARAMAWARVPELLILVTQFVYRYLFVIAEEAAVMLRAARSRQGQCSSRVMAWRVAGGTLGALFARSSKRATAIHQSMLARGFRGEFPQVSSHRFALGETALLAGTAVAAVLMRALL